MPDPRMAELLTAKMIEGMIHPGTPENNYEKRPVLLPFRYTSGMPKEYADQMKATAKLWAEAILHTIETDGESEIVHRTDAASRRNTVERVQNSAWSRNVPVHCRCDTDYRDPLLVLKITDDPHTVVNGKQIIKGLSKRSPDCPHQRIA